MNPWITIEKCPFIRKNMLLLPLTLLKISLRGGLSSQIVPREFLLKLLKNHKFFWPLKCDTFEFVKKPVLSQNSRLLFLAKIYKCFKTIALQIHFYTEMSVC